MGLLVGIHVLPLINSGIIYSDRNRFWFFFILFYLYFFFCLFVSLFYPFERGKISFILSLCMQACMYIWMTMQVSLVKIILYGMRNKAKKWSQFNLPKKKWLRLNCKFLMTFSNTFPVIWSFSSYPTSHYPNLWDQLVLLGSTLGSIVMDIQMVRSALGEVMER